MLATLVVLALSVQPAGSSGVLFDGTSLKEWTLENTDASKVMLKDGAIRFEKGFGWLRSNREFKDFVLTLEVRFLNGDANSGIFIRSAATSDREPARDGVVRGWPDNAYAVQAREIGQDSPTVTSPLAGRVMMTRGIAPPYKEISFDADGVRRVFKPIGEWQRYEIECVGPRVTVTLNGVMVAQAEIGRLSGHIGLQGEVGVVEYRNISIREVISK